jgi:cytolysin-activating lysine-acyltransferase
LKHIHAAKLGLIRRTVYCEAKRATAIYSQQVFGSVLSNFISSHNNQTSMAVFPLAQLIKQLDLPKDNSALRSLAVGLALRCLERQNASISLGTVLNQLLPPIFSDQYEFYVDQVGRIAGFITWATTDAKGTNLLLEYGCHSLSSTEWSAGKDLWIIDFIALDGNLAEIIAALRDTRFANQKAVTYIRQKKNVRLVKQLSREDRNSFVLGKTPRNPTGQQLTTRFDILHGHAASLRSAVDLGNAVLGSIEAVQHLQSPLGRVMHIFREALAIQQCRTYFNSAGQPVGNIVWAWISDETKASMRTTPIERIHTSEWNEGRQLCFVDIALSPSTKALISTDILETHFPEESTVLLYTQPNEASPGTFIRLARHKRHRANEGWLESLFPIATPALALIELSYS